LIDTRTNDSYIGKKRTVDKGTQNNATKCKKIVDMEIPTKKRIGKHKKNAAKRENK